MKNYIRLATLCAATICGAHAYGQSALEKKANREYENFDYYRAIDYYSAIDNRSIPVERNLAKSYVYVGENQKAEQSYAKIAQSNETIAEDVWEYGQILMKNEKYDEAWKQFQRYQTLNPGDKRAEAYASMPDMLEKSKAETSNFTMKNLAFNSDQEDFAPVLYNGNLIFASSRRNDQVIVHKWNRNRMSYLDLYMAHVNSSGELGEIEKIDDKWVNKKYHEGPVSFSPDGHEMFITRTNYTGKATDGVRNLQLFRTVKTSDKWSEPIGLPFNSNDYSVGHAAMSADGAYLFFASDMPGGKGGVDLYMSKRSGTFWEKPVNIAALNTAGNDLFPAMHGDGIFSFASDGHPGLGGLDVFVAKYENGTFRSIQHVGQPLNSPLDDFSMYLDQATLSGYISSNRKSGKGNDDIYAFTMREPFRFGQKIMGQIVDSRNNTLPDVTVSLLNERGEILEQKQADANGYFEFNTETGGRYIIRGTKDKYFENEEIITLDENADVVESELRLTKDPGISLLARISDRSTNEPLNNVKISLVNNMTGEKTGIVTDANGEVMLPITDKKLNDRISYNFRLEKDGYISKVVTYNRQLDKEGRYVISEEMNFGLEKIGVGVDIAKAIDLQPIYFDLGKALIRPDAAVELDKIVQVMNENPTMVVELGAHTDCRGTVAANNKLSQKRAVSSAEYIRKRIANPGRITGKGYGETRLLNSCGCEGSVKSTCPEEEHAKNRRTEFIILKM